MNKIIFTALEKVPKSDFIDLMNTPKVGHLLPLLNTHFSENDYLQFIEDKKQLWEKHGYGPYAFLIDDVFAGWGGLQYEDGDADFALILHPQFWGCGREIFTLIRDQAFSEMKMSSITALLPPARKNANAIKRLGFLEDGEILITNKLFRRYRLTNPPP